MNNPVEFIIRVNDYELPTRLEQVPDRLGRRNWLRKMLKHKASNGNIEGILWFTILEKYERFWLDLDQDVVLGSGLCERLGHLGERWGEAVGSSIGLRTLNERINQIAPLLEQAHQTPITQVPTGTIKTDRRGRRRGQHKGKRMVLLVALGWWADGSGMREILDGGARGGRNATRLATGRASRSRTAGGDPRRQRRARSGSGPGIWYPCDRATLCLSQAAQRGRQSARRPRLFTNLYP